jgi:hypothetical protein
VNPHLRLIDTEEHDRRELRARYERALCQLALPERAAIVARLECQCDDESLAALLEARSPELAGAMLQSALLRLAGLMSRVESPALESAVIHEAADAVIRRDERRLSVLTVQASSDRDAVLLEQLRECVTLFD